MPDTNSPPTSQPDKLADLQKVEFDWPENFTDEDKRIMAAIDLITTDLAQAFLALALAHRQKVFSALLARRDALN